ncbi:penicillin-binding transpeptidase domain-containing protein [Planomicrobium sp. CPCC 101079]|uniref:penicillin-binding transpeptidase domain-containing protein n=1 Tax=Planomicrobium sp. CPCC 101079 TaxID=2599618 RepID=UPI0011B6B5C6|nr:penicillin-binding transpeptidase domain-containing protein [Planomicrobium sp. CPCC 101079]TWT01606.1 penicillin-binding transpeptidase domain-containing protein [Planomicrobium sp. CPCC 101079]
MNKRWIGLFFATVFLLASCQPEEQVAPKEQEKAVAQSSPTGRVEEFIKLWQAGNFQEMYDSYLNEGTKGAFREDVFIGWQEQLKEELEVTGISIDYTKPEEGTGWSPEEPADFPIAVDIATIAGPVQFEKTLTLLYENNDWFVEWDPSFIFPQLEEGDQVKTEITKPDRGEIVDRNGKGIAINGTGYEIGIIPGNFDEDKKEELAKLLKTTPAAIDEQLNQSWVRPDHYVPVAKVAKNNKQTLEKIFAITGTERREIPLREYPYGKALAHVSGFIGPITAEQLNELKDKGYTEEDLIGRQGLERSLEERLRGEEGVRIVIEKARSGAETINVAEKSPEHGDTVKLTIDAKLQKAAYDAMDGEAGTSAAVNPNTGETLVLLSSPSYNPNDFILGMSSSRYNKLQNDPLNPLFTRFAASYAPGSAIKPVFAAIAMEAGTLDPDKGMKITGKTWQKPTWGRFRIARLHDDAPNPVDLNTALVYSDNIYFARQALELGRDRLTEGLESFGFGEAMPFEGLNLAASQISNDGLITSEGQLADTSFGQGQMLVNILHLASMYGPFLNGGMVYKPVLFEEEEKAQVWKEGLVRAEKAEILRTSMRNAVTDGFAKSADLKNIPLAGKTGTAEIKATTRDKGKNNGYFVAYNEDDPQFILAMMIEDIGNDSSDKVAKMVAETFEKTAD